MPLAESVLSECVQYRLGLAGQLERYLVEYSFVDALHAIPESTPRVLFVARVRLL